MRGFLAIIGTVATLVVIGGILAIVTGFPASDSKSPVSPTATQLTEAPTATEALAPTPGAEPLPEISVKAPRMELGTTPQEHIDEQYSEVHTFDDGITVRWRPGAYPAEHADEVAQMTREARVEVNQRLNANYDGPVEVLLADQLFTDTCMGCQGFTAADENRIFMLDDGSVSKAEWRPLLVHEMTHLVAAKKIFLPLDLFFAEGLATWSMTDDLEAAGILTPVQTAAWIYRAGAMPPLAELFEDDFAGRMRKRVSYDAAGSFVAFIVDTYGWTAMRRIYTRDPIVTVVGKDWDELEQEWHSYLDGFAGNEINGVGADAWWSAAQQVIAGFTQMFQDPSACTADQWRELTLSRLALNRGQTDLAVQHARSSGLVVGLAG